MRGRALPARLAIAQFEATGRVEYLPPTAASATFRQARRMPNQNPFVGAFHGRQPSTTALRLPATVHAQSPLGFRDNAVNHHIVNRI